MAAGFNGARLHQKVFEERFLYHADRLGYLVGGEFGDWGARRAALGRQPAADRLATSPSGWRRWSATSRTRRSSAGARSTRPTRSCTTASPQLDDVTRGMFLATKAGGPHPARAWTRPATPTGCPETDV